MPTYSQLCKRVRRKRPKRKTRRLGLLKCPQKRATCLKVLTMTPRKPNSAIRKIARVFFHRTYRKEYAYIPGMGGHNLKKFSQVLIRGGRVKDLPGMKYTIIRGKLDLEALSDELRCNARSKYGVKKVLRSIDVRYTRYKF